MKRNIILVPVGSDVGLTSISLGMVRALERQGIKVQFFKPISQLREGDIGPERSTTILATSPTISPLEPFSMDYVEERIGANEMDIMLEEIIARAQTVQSECEVLVLEGLVPTRSHPYAKYVNENVASALDADIVFVTSGGGSDPADVSARLEMAYNTWGGRSNKRLLGTIVNKVGQPAVTPTNLQPDTGEVFDESNMEFVAVSEQFALSERCPVPLLGAIPFHTDMRAPRASDLAKHLNVQILNAGEMNTRRLRRTSFCARSVPYMVNHIAADTLLVTSGDRSDVLVAACLAAMNGVKVGAILLTSGLHPEPQIMELCEQALATGLPVFLVQSNTWQTALHLQNFNNEVPVDDAVRIEFMQDYVASCIDENFVTGIAQGSARARRLSPSAFRYQLTELARAAKKRVVLPEGDEPRTVQAAAIAAERGIAQCVLLGDPAEIERVAAAQGVTLGPGVEIVDPQSIREQYVAPMVELRKHKGLEEVVAREQLEDNVVLGTMMLQQDHVDGLVSGAVHTTANTIRPALQLIKTAPNSNLVSSVFFMLLPDQVLIYGDCAINPDPTSEQLADIAIQSAESAKAFGIEPRVAMISYSTGSSGSGSDVEKVRQATELAQKARPDLVIDGPLQYDAAVMPNVAASKAPDSPVAGKATVFVFPDLNTGNTTYKAVQRSADLISIGPMLQGLGKPVNDLSRGALVDDIVYTIALTAIQADQQ
ncbi:phosphate acetyltransferase [Paraferrimonas sedimenticola]|uniref:Phosphate acetyltransferase n=1 Tax=Paraferrimonas sedimenticola TaxID=375674 RepID=A0AA37VSP4_9GAMM|nr:phosphate acetyltransferase [Paraferrimonas sedimenticola]GLP94811.1 phosphate acetyltransferase [Paraferrimonas sedimenticola]